MGLKSKDLLGMKQLTAEEIMEILDTAKTMKLVISSANKKTSHLQGKSVVTLFYENSTRTRLYNNAEESQARLTVTSAAEALYQALEMQEIDSHESSHSFVAMLLGRRVSEKVVKKNSGHIMSSGPGWSHMFTSLAPYTLPLVTYLGLAFRSLIAWQSTWLFDIIVGMTMGFYIYRHMTETRDYQPDINHFRTKLFPYLYIAVWTVFNFNVIMVTFWSSKNFFTALWWVLQHLVVW